MEVRTRSVGWLWIFPGTTQYEQQKPKDKVPFWKFIKILLIGNNEPFHEFVPFLGYLEIKKGHRYTKNLYNNENLHFTQM